MGSAVLLEVGTLSGLSRLALEQQKQALSDDGRQLPDPGLMTNYNVKVR
jgi:hypothetical protein